MKDLTIVRVDMGTISSELLRSWANLYCEIWKEPPWNEDFWKPEEVSEDFRSEMCNPGAGAFLSVCRGSVVGFTHGYLVSCEKLREIAGSDMLDYLFENTPSLFYVDELGVASSYRGNRISLNLSSELIGHAKGLGMSGMVLRTDIDARAARRVYTELGFSELSVHDSNYPNRTYWFLSL